MRDCVVDISHYSGLQLDFQKAKSSGIEAVIHKATQGTRYVDPRLIINRTAILDAGLLFGVYCFGTGNATGLDQADYLLSRVPDLSNTLVALDFEPNPQGPTMTLRQAQDFCAAVENHIKRPVVVYTGMSMLPGAVRLQQGGFGDRGLWWAQYGSSPSHAPKIWPLKLWQYTDHGFVEGIGHCDRSEFFGDDLLAFWRGSPL